MDATIIIPTYNRFPPFLTAALRTACHQTANVEVIVIDDGSNPRQDLVVRMVEQQTGHQIHCLWQENAGVAGALNAALCQATTDYIQWLPSDDLFLYDKTARQLEALKASGDKVSYCAYYDGVPQAQVYWPAPTYPDRDAFFAALKKHCFVNAATVMWHRTVFEDIGYFDSAYKHAQDYEFLLRCAESYAFRAVNVPLVRRRIHDGQMINTLKDPAEAIIKAAEMRRLAERYGVTAKAWIPEG